MSEDKVVDISELPRPAAGTSKVPMPESGMATPEVLERVSEGESIGPQAARGEGTYEKPKVYKPPLTNATLQDHQKHSVAMAIVSGVPYAEIAGLVRHTPKYVKQCVEQDEDLQKYIEHYTNLKLKATVEYEFDMQSRHPVAWEALDDSLVSSDENVRFRAMEYVFKQSNGLRAQGNTNDKSGEFNIGLNPEAHKVLSDATTGIHSLLKQIASGELVAAPIDKHLHSDLPGPEDVVGHVVKHG